MLTDVLVRRCMQPTFTSYLWLSNCLLVQQRMCRNIIDIMGPALLYIILCSLLLSLLSNDNIMLRKWWLIMRIYPWNQCCPSFVEKNHIHCICEITFASCVIAKIRVIYLSVYTKIVMTLPTMVADSRIYNALMFSC